MKRSAPTWSLPMVLTLMVLGVGVSQAEEFLSDYITVTQHGDGPDVVLLHGFACRSDVWNECVETFQDQCTLHLVQVRGLGGATLTVERPEKYLDTLRDEVARYIQERDLDHPALVGHSMGGLISLLVAGQHPDLVSRVLIVDSLPFFSLVMNPSATVESMTQPAESMAKALNDLDETQFVARSKISVANLTQSESRQAQLVEWSKASDRPTYAQLMRELLTRDARDEVQSVQCPVTVIFAFDEDMGISEQRITEIYKKNYSKVPNIAFQGVGDCWHFIMWDQPKVFSELFRESLGLQKKKTADAE